jgi:hypothetical protein
MSGAPHATLYWGFVFEAVQRCSHYGIPPLLFVMMDDKNYGTHSPFYTGIFVGIQHVTWVFNDWKRTDTGINWLQMNLFSVRK